MESIYLRYSKIQIYSHASNGTRTKNCQYSHANNGTRTNNYRNPTDQWYCSIVQLTRAIPTDLWPSQSILQMGHRIQQSGLVSIHSARHTGHVPVELWTGGHALDAEMESKDSRILSTTTFNKVRSRELIGHVLPLELEFEH
eukprot:SAG31_NODE_1009_length_10404_cov_27.639981_2_plen_142_part_00